MTNATNTIISAACKKPVQIARKSARCEIYQFPHCSLDSKVWSSPPLASNQWPVRIAYYCYFSISEKKNQNDIWTQVYVSLTEIFIRSWRTPTNNRINLISLETIESMLNIFLAGSMVLPLLVFTEFFFRNPRKNLEVT